jgi:4-hydroxyacetophenone monooxygenase
VSIPGFPNLFCIYGPNTNLVLNGSIIMFSEFAARYATQGIEILRERGGSMECRPEPFAAYNERIDTANGRMAWGIEGVHNWYKSTSGRVSQNWPLSTLEYWRLTEHLDEQDYRFAEPLGAPPTPDTARSSDAAPSEAQV